MTATTLPTMRGTQERNALAMANRRLVFHTMRYYFPQHLIRRYKDDLEQGGFLGLLRAAETWDESRGVAFSGYAVRWIRSQIQKTIDRLKKYDSLAVHGDMAWESDREILDAITVTDDTVASASHGELHAILLQGIATLSRRRRQVMLLRLAGKSQSDIITEIDRSKNTVSKTYTDAVHLLRLWVLDRFGEMASMVLYPVERG